MSNLARFAAVNTKVKTLEGGFLSSKDYRNLLEQKTVIDVFRYLKDNTTYGEILESVDVNSIHRGSLESLVKHKMLTNIDKIIHYFNGDYKRFINTLYAKYEIEELKVIARAVYNGIDTKQFKNSVFIGKYSKVDEEKVFNAKYIRDIIVAFEGTAFYRYLEPLLDNNTKENLFRFEMVLDASYYEILQKQWEKLDKQDIEVLEKGQGIIADLLNLQWIYRGIKFFKLSPEELLNYTIHLGSRLDNNFIKQLCYSKGLDEFYELAAKTRYSFLFKKDETTDIFMGRRLERHMFYELKSVERKNPMTIITTFTYIALMEIEIRDLISIIEIIRYGISPAEAEKYLIRKLREGV
ncbi:MAG: V-type ATPase subunit [Lutisporaceae bacterium]